MAIKTPTGDRIVDFNEEGVTFIFPPGLDNVVVARLELPDDPPEPTPEFEPKRRIIKVKLYEIERKNGTIKPITKFESPFTLEIHYKEIDDENAEGAANKVCAYFDPTIREGKGDWVPFTWDGRFEPKPYEQMPQPHKKKEEMGYIGFGVATISKWPDPEMGWGP